jgi:hypothetical protein
MTAIVADKKPTPPSYLSALDELKKLLLHQAFTGEL